MINNLKKTVAVIVTHNRLEKLKQTITNSLQEELDKIIVVNNNSSDGTKEYLNSLDKDRLIIKHLDENIGGAGGFHVGFQAALEESGAEWLVCYDDDAYPEEGMIEKFKGLELDDSISALAASVYFPSGELSVMNKVRSNPFKSIQKFINTFVQRKSIYISEEAYDQNSFTEIDASSFVGFFIKTNIVRKIGLPRTELFIYGDDLIYTLSLTMQNYRLVLAPNIRFIHDCGTLVNNQEIYAPIWKVYYSYRNRIEMYRVSSRWLYLPITLLQIIPWTRKKRHYKNPDLYMKLLQLAVRDALRGDFSKKHADILKIVAAYEQ